MAIDICADARRLYVDIVGFAVVVYAVILVNEGGREVLNFVLRRLRGLDLFVGDDIWVVVLLLLGVVVGVFGDGLGLFVTLVDGDGLGFYGGGADAVIEALRLVFGVEHLDFLAFSLLIGLQFVCGYENLWRNILPQRMMTVFAVTLRKRNILSNFYGRCKRVNGHGVPILASVLQPYLVIRIAIVFYGYVIATYLQKRLVASDGADNFLVWLARIHLIIYRSFIKAMEFITKHLCISAHADLLGWLFRFWNWDLFFIWLYREGRR